MHAEHLKTTILALQGTSDVLTVTSPIDGSTLARVGLHTADEADAITERAASAFRAWRTVPAPVRGELVRRIGDAARARKTELGAVITHEVGKITAEAEGEVQEWIDICDFACGLSRQLYGKTIASERLEHRMMEQWHPLGPIGVITAFNFPCAVWAWNAMIGLVCGDPVVWKPSESAPLTALMCHQLALDAAKTIPEVPDGLLGLVLGEAGLGRRLAADPRLPLISATGSTRMGRDVAAVVGGRLGRSLLELGGNNAMIVTETADLELAVRAAVFSAVGTCGQRCTSLRRLLLHTSVASPLLDRLVALYDGLRIGDPREAGTLVGPLIDHEAKSRMARAIEAATAQGGELLWAYVRPAIVRIGPRAPIVQRETFAPLLYVIEFDDLDEAISIQNDVPQGLSSAIFTRRVGEAERFLSPAGSDCGIANVNIGTSGAEIGGAFGGEKETGGGRESGSDSWKAYMRRATNTVNYSDALPLAQGISFDV